MILSPENDAQGRLIYDCYKGNGDVLEIVERDDGLVEAYPARPYLSEYKDWPRHQRLAVRAARGRILDIGCGGGRHALYLQQRGHSVLGIDVSPWAIRVCRLRGLKNTRLMSIGELGPKLGRFDTILMLGNNFGLFANRSRARSLLRGFQTITNPGARIIAETLDIYKAPVPNYHRKYQASNRRRGRMPGQVRIRIRYRDLSTPWFDYLLASQGEMKELVGGTGWRVGSFIKSKGPPYIAVIRRE